MNMNKIWKQIIVIMLIIMLNLNNNFLVVFANFLYELIYKC